MTSHTPIRAAIVIGGLATALVVAVTAIEGVLSGITQGQTDAVAGSVIYGAATASFVLVGVLLTVRAPDNRIGPVLMLAGALLTLAIVCRGYGAAGADADPDWPGSALASVVGQALLVYPIVLALVGIPLIFPNGHLISRRWRFVVWLVVVAVVGSTMSLLIPLAVPGLEAVADLLGGFASATSIIGFGAGVAALWVRYRRGDPTERQQLKWLVAVAALAAIFFPIGIISPVPEIIFLGWLLGSLTLVALPLAIAVAVLRYRLFEIDRIISRTLSYAIVIGLLGAVFVGIMLVLQAEVAGLTGNGGIAVAISTLAVFALFQPVLRRVRRTVDRRFDRARYDGERTAGAFAERLRWETDMDLVTGDLRATVDGAVAPTALAIWLRHRTAAR